MMKVAGSLRFRILRSLSVIPDIHPVRRLACSRLVLAVFFFLLALCGLDRIAEAQIQNVQGISTVAGNGTGGYSGDGGAATSAEIHAPTGVALDSAGNLYIADSNNHVIRKVAANTGTISTVAGNGTPGYSGDGGAATSAELHFPAAVAVDSAGNLYIADSSNSRIRKVAAGTGTITTAAGNGTAGYGGDGGAATSAELYYAAGVAVDSSGNLYIADTSNSRIRKVAAGTGTITTVAGNGTQDYSGDGGAATSAALNQPFGVVVDSAGNLYIVDSYNQRIRKVAAATGTITTVAGNGTLGYSGDGGAATSAELYYPDGATVDSAGNLYIADTDNQRVREVAAGTGTITTVAGNGTLGYSGDGGAATSAEMYDPFGVAVDSLGNLYIADGGNSRIRKVAAATVFPTTAVGSTSPQQSLQLQLNAAQTITSITATKSQGGQQEYAIGTITGCTVDGATTNASGTICVVPVTFQPTYSGERGVSLQVVAGTSTFSFGLNGLATGPQVAFTPGTISTVAGNGTQGYSGDGGAPTSAEMYGPVGVAVDSAGNFYFADSNNNRIRKVAAGTGTISTVAGNGTGGYSGDGGAATSAELKVPYGVAVDSAGNLYIADTSNQRIREVAAGTGTITTVAGNGTESYSGDGGLATSAELSNPVGVAVDSVGNLYVVDFGNNRIRKIAAGTGTISTVAGNGTAGYSGDGGAATSAELNVPYGIAVDSAGNLYIGDSVNQRIRKVDASTGTISTAAGNGTSGFSGDGGAATSAELNDPSWIAVDSAGNFYFADSLNQRIRKVDAGAGTISTAAGNGTSGFSGDGGAATSAELNNPVGVAVDSLGNLYFADFFNNRIRDVDVANPPSLSFAATSVGATSSDSPQMVKIANIGNQPLIFATPGTGSNPSYPANFPGNSTDTALCASGASLSPGTDCDVSVDFMPTAVGSNSGSVVLTDNALNVTGAMQAITLSGTGVALVPTLSFATIAAQTFGNAPFTVSATSASSGAVTYAVVSGPATITGSTVTLTGAGTVSLSASQAADGNYTAATVTTSFAVAGEVPMLSFAAILAQTYGNAPFTVSATSASSGAVTYTVVSGPATISGSTVTLTGVGTVTLNASQAASGNYAVATVATSFTVTAAFTLSSGSSSTSATTTMGGAATYSLSLSPGSEATFPDAIAFAATGLPTGSTATFSPATVAAGSGATSVALTIQTSTSPTALNEKFSPDGPMAPVALGLLLLPALGVKSVRRRLLQIRSLLAVLAFAALSLGAVVSLTGCDHSSPQQSVKNYTVVVTATDQTNGAKSSTDVTLTVQ